MNSHVCHILKCGKTVAPKLLMCPEHWDLVPLHMRRPILDNFNPKQCTGKVRPSDAWLKAARAAINHVEFALGLKSILRGEDVPGAHASGEEAK